MTSRSFSLFDYNLCSCLTAVRFDRVCVAAWRHLTDKRKERLARSRSVNSHPRTLRSVNSNPPRILTPMLGITWFLPPISCHVVWWCFPKLYECVFGFKCFPLCARACTDDMDMYSYTSDTCFTVWAAFSTLHGVSGSRDVCLLREHWQCVLFALCWMRVWLFPFVSVKWYWLGFSSNWQEFGQASSLGAVLLT